MLSLSRSVSLSLSLSVSVPGARWPPGRCPPSPPPRPAPAPVPRRGRAGGPRALPPALARQLAGKALFPGSAAAGNPASVRVSGGGAAAGGCVDACLGAGAAAAEGWCGGTGRPRLGSPSIAGVVDAWSGGEPRRGGGSPAPEIEGAVDLERARGGWIVVLAAAEAEAGLGVRGRSRGEQHVGCLMAGGWLRRGW